MNDTNPLAQTVAVLLFLLACLSLNAQHTVCFGIDDATPTLTKEDKQALRLYSPLKWYNFSTYKFKGGGKRAAWIGYAVAGILHGGREAYYAEPNVFEKRLSAAPLSFWGSEQWKRNYYDRNPELPHKPNIWNPIRDYYHFSGAATKAIWIGGAFTVGMSKQPMKYSLIDLLIGAVITSGSASLTYNILR